MKRITFATKKGQEPQTIITLPTGAECQFKGGQFSTDDSGIAHWLETLGYEEYKARKKQQPVKGKGATDAER